MGRTVMDEVLDHNLKPKERQVYRYSRAVLKEIKEAFPGKWGDLTQKQKRERITIYYGFALAMEELAEKWGLPTPKF